MGAVHLPQKKKYTRVIGDAVVMSQAEAIVFEAMRNLRLDGTYVLASMRVFSAAGITLIKAYRRHWKPTTHAASIQNFNHHQNDACLRIKKSQKQAKLLFFRK